MENLRDLDKIAYVRFASVYRDFQDEQAFFNELKNLMRQKHARERPDTNGRPEPNACNLNDSETSLKIEL